MFTTKTVIPFLRSCRQEISSVLPNEITGKIPEWLQGTLLRMGPGLLDVGPDRYVHAFDGLALMRKFSIRNGNVTYQNRFLRSDSYRKNMEANRIAVSEFGTRRSPDPCKTIFQKLSSIFTMEDFTDNDVINIVKYTDEYYACTETNFIWKINPENLESERKVNLSKFVPLMTGTAHPHEGENGSVFNVGNSIGKKSSYTIVEFPPRVHSQQSVFDGGKVIGKIPMSRPFAPSYYHSFGMTDNYFIFVEQPLVMSVPKFLYQRFSASGTYAQCLDWQPQYKVKFHIMHRKNGTLLDTQYTADAFMVFHHINAYEEDGQLVIDMCCYKDGDVIKALYLKALEEYTSNSNELNVVYDSEPKRYVLPLQINRDGNKNLVNLKNSSAKAFIQADGSVHCQPENLCEPGWFAEMPRINYEKFNGKKYRYFYGLSTKKGSMNSYAAKMDLEKQIVSHWSENNAIPSEPVFVSHPKNDGKEDQGVLLVSVLFSDNDKKVALLILDAETMGEIGRATFLVKSEVPADYHGLFISNFS